MAKRVTEKRSVKEARQKKGKGKGKQKVSLGKRFINFFKRLRNELKKVTWPERLQLKRTSAVTFAIIISVVLLIFFSDSILRGLLSIGGFNKPTKQQAADTRQTSVTAQQDDTPTDTAVTVDTSQMESADVDESAVTETAEE